nr:VENN motif pre-toxin domain-containing protein [Acinetobacter sp. S40]
MSLSGGTSFNKDKAGSDNNATKAANPTSNENWRNATSFSPGLPQHEENKDSSSTYATLSEGNISIGGKATTAKDLGIHSDITTANRQVETLPNLQEILDKQKTVANATSTIAAATRTYSQNQQAQAVANKQVAEQQAIADLQAKGGEEWEKYQTSSNPNEKQQILKNTSPSYQTASELAQDWGMGGDKSRALNAVTMAVTGALGGQTDLQVAANTLAPYAANVIGEKFGHGEDKNTTTQMVSHAILGAALAYVNNGNPAAGGSAAVASEAAANYLVERYNDGKTAINPQTGQFDPNLLPEDAKTQIRDLTAAIGAVVGGTVGDSAFNAQLASVVGQNAVENNELLLQAKFAIKHPQIAYQIGSVDPNPASILNPNISTIASTYQLNLLNPAELFKLGYTKDEVVFEGSMGNALRHTLWQAMITKEFGKNIAIEVGNAHESYEGTNYNQKSGLTLNKADELIDQLNNQIGRNLSSTSLSNSDLAKKVLDTYASEGLYQAIKDENGTYSVQKVKLNNQLYELAKSKLNTLDQTGAGIEIQNQRETRQKVKSNSTAIFMGIKQ